MVDERLHLVELCVAVVPLALDVRHRLAVRPGRKQELGQLWPCRRGACRAMRASLAFGLEGRAGRRRDARRRESKAARVAVEKVPVVDVARRVGADGRRPRASDRAHFTRPALLPALLLVLLVTQSRHRRASSSIRRQVIASPNEARAARASSVRRKVKRRRCSRCGGAAAAVDGAAAVRGAAVKRREGRGAVHVLCSALPAAAAAAALGAAAPSVCSRCGARPRRRSSTTNARAAGSRACKARTRKARSTTLTLVCRPHQECLGSCVC